MSLNTQCTGALCRCQAECGGGSVAALYIRWMSICRNCRDAGTQSCASYTTHLGQARCQGSQELQHRQSPPQLAEQRLLPPFRPGLPSEMLPAKLTACQRKDRRDLLPTVPHSSRCPLYTLRASCNAQRESLQQRIHHLLPALSQCSSSCRPRTLHLLQDTCRGHIEHCRANRRNQAFAVQCGGLALLLILS